jgi:hypothetical protein
MTERQRIAMAYPCYRAKDTMHPRLKRLEPPWSTILSVNK